MATINLQFSLLLAVYTGFLVLFCIARISDSQGNEGDLPPKPIDASIIIDCPECNNSRPCTVVMNGVSTSDYPVMDNGSLIVPANDTTVYGTLYCGGNTEQLKKYIICPPPPEIGQSYDWLNASSNTTMVTVDNTVGITASFFHLPHGGISVIIDGNVSNDGDMDCSKNSGIMNKIVNYTCISLQPSVNKVIAQLSFCSIEFTSHPLNITIGIQSDVSTSSNPATDSVTLFNITATTTATDGSSSSTTPIITPNSTFSPTLTTSTVNQDTYLFMTSSISMETGIPHGNRNVSVGDDGFDGRVIVAIVVPIVVVVIIVMIIIAVFVSYKYFRANRGSSTRPRPAAVNMAMLGDTASQPTGTDGTIQSTGAGNIIQPTGAGNTDDMFTDDGKSLDNTGHPPVQGDIAEGDVPSVIPEDETNDVGHITRPIAEADTENFEECTSSGAKQTNARILLSNGMTTQRSTK